MAEIFSLILPALLLALMLVAPRRGGRPAWKRGATAAKVVLVWAAVCIVVGLAWNHFGLAALWWLSGNE